MDDREFDTFSVAFEFNGRLSSYIGLAERRELRHRVRLINADGRFTGKNGKIGRFLKLEQHDYFGFVAVFAWEAPKPTIH